jgi:hypothetical protein
VSTAEGIVESVQTRLAELRYYTALIDGIAGPLTDGALVAFKRALGWRPRPVPVIETLPRLFADDAPPLPEPTELAGDPPWLREILKVRGLHERRNNARLREWLASDGRTIGDPGRLPWCGDAVQTPIALTLPDEPLPKNTWLAQAWSREFGRECGIVRGAVCVFWRGSPSSWKGHVGFVVGDDAEAVHVLGGNQGNAITDDARISRHRLIGCYWPLTYPMTGERQRRDPVGALSTDEA